MAITGAAIVTFDGGLDPFCGSGQDCAQTFSVPPGGSRLFYVTCTAAQVGTFSASLGIASNAASGASTAPMSCLGLGPPIIQLSQGALDFGIAHQCEYGEVCGPSCGTQPLTQTLTITNAAPPPSRLDFYITPELLSGPHDDFIVGNLCAESTGGCSLEAGASMSIDITFRPRGTVLYTSPLSLVSLYPGQPAVSIPLHAEGGHGHLVFDSPGALGTVPVGLTLTTTLTVHNDGRSCLDLDGRPPAHPRSRSAGLHGTT